MQSEPHKIIVKVWHNGSYHFVVWNVETSQILRLLYREGNTFYNPKQAEWDILSAHRLPND